jgi:hypothetical protein
MKALLLLLFIPVWSYAQTTDSVDNIVLKVPASWQVSRQQTFTQYTLFDKNIKSFCQLTIYQQQPSTNNKQKDFENEWKELIEKNFTMVTLVKPVAMKDKKGNSFLRYGASGVAGDGNKYFVQLNMYDCGASIQSVIAVSGTKEHLSRYDSLWQGLITKVKRQNTSTVNAANNNTAPAAIDAKLIGSWEKTSSSPSAYTNGVLTNPGYAGYTKGRYDFRQDGTYVFQSESSSNSTEYRLIDEKGTYAISGNKLTISPSNSLYRVVDDKGKLKKSEKIPANKRTYTWQTHYFEGLQETALILGAGKENVIDGGFSVNEAFPNSFIYSPGKTIEFRFLPLK